MRPSTQTTADLEKVIQRAAEVLRADERVAACWLEGSFAEGTADAWSDIDLHVAVATDRFESFRQDRMDVLNRVRPVLAFGENDLGSAWLIYALMHGPVRFDLYVERTEGVEYRPRRESPLVLFDRSALTSRLRVVPEPNQDEIRGWLSALLRRFFTGGMWPVRLWGREEFGNLLLNAVTIVYQFLVPAMMVQDEPRHYFRGAWHNERRLPAKRRRQVSQLLCQVLEAFAGIDDGLDFDAVARVHERLLGAVWHELRRACEMYGVQYLEEAESEMEDYYARELALQIDGGPVD